MTKMMTKLMIVVGMLATPVLGWAIPSTVTLTQDGVVVVLSGESTTSGGVTTWDMHVDVDTSGGSSSLGWISAMGFKVSSTLSSVTRDSFPSLFNTGSITLNAQPGGNGNGFFADYDVVRTAGSQLLVGSLHYTWDYTLTAPAGTATDVWSVHMQYEKITGSASHPNVVNTYFSQNGTPQNTPDGGATLALLGLGLVGLGALRRKIG